MSDELDMEMEPELMTLVDEDGVEHSFEIVDSLDTDEGQYLALVPAEEADEDTEEDGELVILKVVTDEEDEDGEYLEPIDDEDEFHRISEIFMERLSEYFDFKE